MERRTVDSRPAGPQSAIAPFTAQEWEALCRAPIITFLVVAGTGGEIRRQETEAFGRLLARQVLSLRGDLITRVMRGTLIRRDALIAETTAAKVDPGAILQATRAALDARLSAREARAFKLALVGLGKAVAESSGRRGLLGFFRGGIDHRKKVALARLARHLGLVPQQ